MTCRRSFGALGIALALLCGCASAPEVRYYVLSPVVPAAARIAAMPIAVTISDVRVPLYLDRQQLVVRDGPHRVRIVDSALWAGDLREDLTRALAGNLGHLLASDRVMAAPQGGRIPPDYRLAVQVERFERGADGRVAFAAHWWLNRVADGKLLASPLTELSGAALPAGAGFDEVVASMSVVYGRFAETVAAELRARGTGGR